ncbi:MAG: N-acetylmuramoyl-L-alanine amidase [Ruminococcaceae bacterium]|nr:N-acetylmuramoyl-L-alanine amidase [Oscillospiraceae bacterium]
MPRRKICLLAMIPLLLFWTVTAIIIDSTRRTLPAAAAASITAGRGVPTLVIDPGHGGLDGGAVSPDGLTESGLNLAIALKTREIARLFGNEPVMTRTSETLDYPETEQSIHDKKVWDQKQRVARINAVENAVLLSVHQNKFPDRRPRGTLVLYGKADGSKQLAELTHSNLTELLYPENRRVAAPVSDSIYLMKHLRCPAILVECGFLSNPEETQLLRSDSYQTKLALILYSSYLQYFS